MIFCPGSCAIRVHYALHTKICACTMGSLPESFRAAFVVCIKSSLTLKKVVLENHLKFPLSVLDDCNIRDLMSGSVSSCHPLLCTTLTLPLTLCSTPSHLMASNEYPVHNSKFGQNLTLRSLRFSPWESPDTMMFSTLSALLPLCSNTLLGEVYSLIPSELYVSAR
jgi:hypothetical protein